MGRLIGFFLVVFQIGLFADEATRLRMLFVIDDVNSKMRGGDLKEACQKDLENWNLYLRLVFKGRESRGTIDIMQGDDVGPDSIRNYYRNLELNSSESLFFFYCGHGAFDRDPKKGHFLAMGGGNILRSEIRELMGRHTPKGSFILTDACANFVDFGRYMVLQPDPWRWELFRQLFLATEGVYDVNAASPGQIAWLSNDSGGIFSNAMTFTLIFSERSKIDQNKDRSISWPEFMQAVSSDMAKLHDRLKTNAEAGSPIGESRGQTPYAFSLGPYEIKK